MQIAFRVVTLLVSIVICQPARSAQTAEQAQDADQSSRPQESSSTRASAQPLFSVKVESQSKVVKAGSPVVLRLSITNLSNHAETFGRNGASGWMDTKTGKAHSCTREIMDGVEVRASNGTPVPLDSE